MYKSSQRRYTCSALSASVLPANLLSISPARHSLYPCLISQVPLHSFADTCLNVSCGEALCLNQKPRLTRNNSAKSRTSSSKGSASVRVASHSFSTVVGVCTPNMNTGHNFQLTTTGGESLPAHRWIPQTTLLDPLRVGSLAAMRSPTVCCANMCPRSDR